MLRRILDYLQTSKEYVKPLEVRQAHIKGLFNRPSLKGVLDDNFLDGMKKQRDELQQRTLRLFAIEATIIGILLLCLMPVSVSVSLFGVQSSELPKLRELLLILLASINFMRFQTRAASSFAREILYAGVTTKSGEDAELLFVLLHRYGIGGFSHPRTFQPSPEMFPGAGYQVLLLLLRFLSHLIQGSLAFMFLAIEAWTMVQIYMYPSINVVVSIAIIFYVVLITTTQILWRNLAMERFAHRAYDARFDLPFKKTRLQQDP